MQLYGTDRAPGVLVSPIILFLHYFIREYAEMLIDGFRMRWYLIRNSWNYCRVFNYTTERLETYLSVESLPSECKVLGSVLNSGEENTSRTL